MKLVGLVVGVLMVLGLFVAGGLVMTFFNYKNQAVQLENLAKAAQDDNKVVFDKTWKVLQQKAGVTDKYSESFKSIYVDLMDARYGAEDKNGSPLFKFIRESNPNFDQALFLDLSRSIESLRNEFANSQKRLIDIKREHDNLRTVFPGSLFLSFAGVRELEITIVTSSKTEKVFQTGKEDDVNLF